MRKVTLTVFGLALLACSSPAKTLFDTVSAEKGRPTASAHEYEPIDLGLFDTGPERIDTGGLVDMGAFAWDACLQLFGEPDLVEASDFGVPTFYDRRTAELAVRTDSPDGGLFEYGGGDPFRITLEGGVVVFDDGTGWSLPSGVRIDDGQWHHVAVTYEDDGYPDGVGDVRVVVDGEEQAADPHELKTLRGAGIFLGDGLEGDIDNVRLWESTRSASEIASTMTRVLNGDEPGLILHWDMNAVAGEGRGVTLPDRAPAGYDYEGTTDGTGETPVVGPCP